MTSLPQHPFCNDNSLSRKHVLFTCGMETILSEADASAQHKEHQPIKHQDDDGREKQLQDETYKCQMNVTSTATKMTNWNVMNAQPRNGIFRRYETPCVCIVLINKYQNDYNVLTKYRQ